MSEDTQFTKLKPEQSTVLLKEQKQQHTCATKVLLTLIIFKIVLGVGFFFYLLNVTHLVEDGKSFEAHFLANKKLNSTRFNERSEIFVNQTHIFDVPKKLWIFKPKNTNYLGELLFKNNVDFAEDSGFEVTQIGRDNFKDYLPITTSVPLEALLELLQKRSVIYGGNLKYQISRITKILILLNVLNENGGVMTDGDFAMTQDLSWLRSIAGNPYVNRGNRGIKPQVVGFYSFTFTSPKSKENIKPFQGMEQVDKYMNIFPAMQDYFLCAYNKTEFVTQLIYTIYGLLIDPNHFISEKENYNINSLVGYNMYSQYFFVAVQVVLQDKQKEIDSVTIDDYRHFAIDYYGLSLINCLYGPYKFEILRVESPLIEMSYLLARYTQEEFYAHTGPMLYIANINPPEQFNSFLQHVRAGKGEGKEIMEGSFLHKVFFSHSQVSFLSKRKEKPFKNESNAQWTSLPKVIWMFWNEGIDNSMINNQICAQSLRRMAALSGYKVIQVSLANAAEYIGSDMFQRIQRTLNNSKLASFPPTKSDLIRLALLLKHGGIYMDASMVPIQNLDWIINIGRHPSEFIFNRYGELPKVFMTWHPFRGGMPGQWTVSQKYNTKSQWHLGYENALIAAEKGSELIRDWLYLLLELYKKTYDQVDQIYKQSGLTSHRWTKVWTHYLIPMETLKCVIGRKQLEIKKDPLSKWDSASDYYKIWSYSSYLGMQRFRDILSLQETHSNDNPFIYRYSQQYVEGLIGKTRHFAKFVSTVNYQLNRFIQKHIDGKFESEAHSQSFFMRRMWNSSYSIGKACDKLKLRVKT